MTFALGTQAKAETKEEEAAEAERMEYWANIKIEKDKEAEFSNYCAQMENTNLNPFTYLMGDKMHELEYSTYSEKGKEAAETAPPP